MSRLKENVEGKTDGDLNVLTDLILEKLHVIKTK